MIKLYDYELSSECYKTRLLLACLGLAFERIELDVYPGCEHRSPWFLAINPLGELPVINIDEFLVCGANPILVYLACRYDPTGRWYPRVHDESLARVATWLDFAARLADTAGAARLHDALFYPADIDACRSAAHRLLRVLDEHLWFAEQEGQDWLCSGEHPSIADIACFPDAMLCEEGGISRLTYPAIRRWTDRVKGMAQFTTMSGIFP